MDEAFQPADKEYKTRVRQSFGRQMVMTTIGATMDQVSPGRVVLRFPYNEKFTQQHGFIHAGIVSTVMDKSVHG